MEPESTPVGPVRTGGGKLFTFVGGRTIRFFEHVGDYAGLVWWMLRNLRNARVYSGNFVPQLVQIGNDSIPIVMFVSMFVGMVTAVQGSHQLYAWIPRTVVGGLVIKSVLLELVPLLSALVLAGKVGATITAEIGSMRVTEQIDALEAMGYDSISFLVTPRVIAGTMMFPVVIVFGDLLAILGGLFGAVVITHIPAGVFISGIKASFATGDALFGLLKAVCFGYAITSISCYQGYYVKGGSAGVGKATMGTVIITCLTVVVLDFVLASVLLS